MQQQQADGVADQVGGGQVAADQKAAEVDPEFGVGQRRALDLQPGHVRDQVVPGRGAPGLDRLSEIGAQGLARLLHHRRLLGRTERVHRLDHPFGPGAELAQPFVVDAQDRGNHIDGDRHAEPAHQVEGRPRWDRIQRLVDDPLHLGTERGDPGVKGLGQRRADALVVGVIQHQDAGGLAARQPFHVRRDDGADHPHRVLGLERIAPQRPIGHQRADIGVTGQDVAGGRVVPMHRTARAQVG